MNILYFINIHFISHSIHHATREENIDKNYCVITITEWLMYCCNINVMGSPPPPISGRRLQMKQLAQATEVRDRDEASTQPQQQETPKRYFNILHLNKTTPYAPGLEIL